MLLFLNFVFFKIVCYFLCTVFFFICFDLSKREDGEIEMVCRGKAKKNRECWLTLVDIHKLKYASKCVD